MRESAQMATRPLVMPETFDGSTGGWEDWVEHFERVATVNGWTEDATNTTKNTVFTRLEAGASIP